MPSIAQGASVDLTAAGDSTLTIQNPGGYATVENPIGTVSAAGGAANWTVDVRSGSVRVNAVTGGLYCELQTDALSSPAVVTQVANAQATMPTAEMLAVRNRLVTWVDEGGTCYRSNATASAAGTALQGISVAPIPSAIGTVMVDWDAAVLAAPTAGWTVEKTADALFAGKTALRVTATAGAADTLTCNITVPPTYFGGAKRFGFPVASGDSYVAGDANNVCQLWLNYSGSTTHRLVSYNLATATPGAWHEGYVYDQDAAGTAHMTGTPQWGKVGTEEVTTVTLVMTKRAGQAIVDAVYIGPIVADPIRQQPALLTLFFDGNYSGQHKYARSLLQAYCMRASMATVVPWIGAVGGTMTAAEIERMYALGHECICHTGTAGNYGWDNTVKYPDGQEYALVMADITAFRDWASAQGYVRGIDYGVVGFTNGLVNTQSISRRRAIARAVADAGMRKVRQLGTYNSSYYGAGGCGDRFVTQSQMVTAATTTGACTNIIDQIILRRGWSGLTFHDIVLSGATGNNYNVADLETVLDYIAAKEAAGLIRTRLFSEAMREMESGASPQ